MDIAIADLVHSNLLPFSLPSDAKFKKVLDMARHLSASYTPPGTHAGGGRLLDVIYETNYAHTLRTLIQDAKLFGCSLFGDGATIVTIPMINILGAGIHNPMAILGIADCTEHIASGGTKDAPYIANLFRPFFMTLNEAAGEQVVDIVFFDGASNVQLGGTILAVQYPRISVAHGPDHAVSLFFSNVFTKTTPYVDLANFAKKLRNIFSSTRHAPTAMFKVHSRKHNRGINLTLLKPSECRYVFLLSVCQSMFVSYICD